MLYYFNNFSSYTLLSQPSDWTVLWSATGSTWLVQNLPPYYLNHVEHTPNTKACIYWNVPGIMTDVNVVSSNYSDRSTSAYPYQNEVAIRISGTAGAENSYFISLEYSPTTGYDVTLNKYVAGVKTILSGATGFVWTINTPISLEIQAVGTTISGKYWYTANAEPQNWQFSVTDTSLSSGYVGFQGLDNQSSGFFNIQVTQPDALGTTIVSHATTAEQLHMTRGIQENIVSLANITDKLDVTFKDFYFGMI